ncbi:MAG: GH116 family glycosyl hydrolase, partial [Mycetocola sp.]
LGAIVGHNFRSDLSTHESTQRVYALNDEGGLLLASWPRGGRPAIPFVYSDEVWTGVEHQVATSLVYAGLLDEALDIERAVRRRYDGTVRSPWNEIECGNHYARSLASWGLLLAMSGAQWDAPTRTLDFTPAADGRYLFTTGGAWGAVEIDGDGIRLTVEGGELDIDHLVLRGRAVRGTTRLAAGETCTGSAATEHPTQETP